MRQEEAPIEEGSSLARPPSRVAARHKAGPCGPQASTASAPRYSPPRPIPGQTLSRDGALSRHGPRVCWATGGLKPWRRSMYALTDTVVDKGTTLPRGPREGPGVRLHMLGRSKLGRGWCVCHSQPNAGCKVGKAGSELGPPLRGGEGSKPRWCRSVTGDRRLCKLQAAVCTRVCAKSRLGGGGWPLTRAWGRRRGRSCDRARTSGQHLSPQPPTPSRTSLLLVGLPACVVAQLLVRRVLHRALRVSHTAPAQTRPHAPSGLTSSSGTPLT